MKHFEETELSEVLCAMICTFARVCGLKYPAWADQCEADRMRYAEAMEVLSDMLATHNAQSAVNEQPGLFDISIWYNDNWRIFPWAEPDYANLQHLPQEFVVQVAEFILAMAGHLGTQLEEGGDE
jgi:hypothetical protein|uniref:Uncharacterized protein n=1 Tax=Myoviridae sp. ctshb19 TaxID=2825194 RepID=A0A8S5UGU9_9CAUD|nr:MAG TPA: hypothetical protein [Myoviridae sp. ctshb19]